MQSIDWKRVAGDAEGGWCSLLGGVFSVSAQQDSRVALSTYAYNVASFEKKTSKGSTHGVNSELFYFYLTFLLIISRSKS